MSYKEYHDRSMEAKDVDPSIICLQYLADRYELNIEQRYWISFLYGCTYSATTTFYIYNEFPDYIKADLGRMSDWWDNNKHKLVFQTDRLRIKSNNQFIQAVRSYRSLCGTSQRRYFKCSNWTQMYNKIEAIKYFGRFSLFNYLDVLNSITDITHKPTYLNMLEAESCRNGLAFSINRPDLVTHGTKRRLQKEDLVMLHEVFKGYLRNYNGNVFQIETTLCAYKKYRIGEKRYIGYYIDRIAKEIEKMSENVRQGVYWDVLWQFRYETFEQKYLVECER